ncbi:polysaccharide deacetylase family protein [Macrococcoides canis]|uniref:polysaccharide deacetylase family protein n=1 Tax=Macrococcoides canis TaxID=1855823 RepID=UPI0020B8B757|nr:polysaccharide deacetylase family protein [Macrococcus canis]UTH01619.1 polysaccharide deacetylase family protein [Macrococcus canis]
MIPKIGIDADAEFRNIINLTIDTVNGQYKELNELLKASDNNLKVASDLINKNTDVQKQLNDLILNDGESDAEVIQARGGYTVLNERLNESDNTNDKAINNISAVEENTKITKPLITFTFDNSYDEQYKLVYPMFKERGMKFALSPVSNDFANLVSDPEYYNYAQLKEMIDYGAELVSHGATGLQLRVTGLNPAQVEYEISEAKRFWDRLGIKTNSYCGTGSIVLDEYLPILKKYHDFAFTVYQGNMSADVATVNEQTDIYKIGRLNLYSLYQLGGLERWKQEVDKVLSSGGWLNFYNHRVDDEQGRQDTVPSADLKALLDYIQSKGIEVVTPSQAISLLNGKMIATENVSTIRKSLEGQAITSNNNMLLNTTFDNNNENWTLNGDATGVTTSNMTYNDFKSVRYDFGTTDNTGKFVGIAQTINITGHNRINLADILTYSTYVYSSTNDVEVVHKISIKNGTTTVSENELRLTLPAGNKILEVSTPTPTNAFDTIIVFTRFYPTGTTNKAIEVYQPKLEKGRRRTPWQRPIVAPTIPTATFLDVKMNNKSVAFPTTTRVPLVWDLVVTDNENKYNKTTGEYTIGYGGIFSIDVQLSFVVGVGDRVSIELYKNGGTIRTTDVRATSTYRQTYNLNSVESFNTGDVIQVKVLLGTAAGDTTQTLIPLQNFLNIVRM